MHRNTTDAKVDMLGAMEVFNGKDLPNIVLPIYLYTYLHSLDEIASIFKPG
jgi:hypothetical protein